MQHSKPAGDPKLTSEQAAQVARLSRAQIQQIDQAILSQNDHQWRKVARIVASVMTQLNNRPAGIPDIFYAQCVRRLVAEGMLESRGNISAMQHSEVRLSEVRSANK